MLIKLLETPTLSSIMCKSRDVQVVMGCLRLFSSLYPDNEEEALSPEAEMFCSAHQNKDVREFSRVVFGERGTGRGGHEP